jgi:transmembrane sensor
MSDIRAEAAAFLVKRGEQWSEADQKALDSWIAQSVAHRVAYLRLDAAWSSADRLAALRPSTHEESAPRRLLPLLMRVAAVVAVASVLGIGAMRALSPAPERVFATKIGGRETVSFADGSKIELNTGTVVRTRMTTQSREVWLDRGEAYFSIKHDPAHPFTVMVAGHRVTDLGTKFFIRRDGGRVEVGLTEGRARVENRSILLPSQSALLAPGDVVTATSDSMSMEKKPVADLDNALAWRRGMLVFHRTPLSQVAAEYNRYNRAHIVIADAETGSRTITATVPVNDLAAFARMAQNFFGLHVGRNGDEIVVTR